MYDCCVLSVSFVDRITLHVSDSTLVRHSVSNSLLAQLVERETVNLEANGSTPLRRDLHFLTF